MTADPALRAMAVRHLAKARGTYCSFVIAHFLSNGVKLLTIAVLYRHAPAPWGDSFVLWCLLSAMWRVAVQTSRFGAAPVDTLMSLVEDEKRSVVTAFAAARREHVRRALCAFAIEASTRGVDVFDDADLVKPSLYDIAATAGDSEVQK